MRVCFVDGGPSFFTPDGQKDSEGNAAGRGQRQMGGKMRDMGGDGEKRRQISGLWRGQGPRGRRQGPSQGADLAGALWAERQNLMR